MFSDLFILVPFGAKMCMLGAYGNRPKFVPGTKIFPVNIVSPILGILRVNKNTRKLSLGGGGGYVMTPPSSWPINDISHVFVNYSLTYLT